MKTSTAPNLSILQNLLKQFDEVEAKLATTNALKPKLEAEIEDAIASGNIEDEKFANSLGAKRGQIELIPAKISQLERHRDVLVQKIQTEFDARFLEFERQFASCRQALYIRLDTFIRPIMAADFMVEHAVSSLVPHTKINRQILGLCSYIKHSQLLSGDVPQAARILIQRAPEAQKILAGFEPQEMEAALAANATAREMHLKKYGPASPQPEGAEPVGADANPAAK